MEWISGNIFIRPNKLPVGGVTPGHTHNHDHTTIFRTPHHVKAMLPNGALIERDFAALSHALIKKDVLHEIKALPHDVPQYVRQLVDVSAGVVAGKNTHADLAEAVEMFWTIHAALPGEYWCVYSHRTPQGDVTQENTGWEAAYV